MIRRPLAVFLSCALTLAALTPAWVSAQEVTFAPEIQVPFDEGRAHLEAGRFTEAAAAFNQVLAVNRGVNDLAVPALIGKAVALKGLGDYKNAAVLYSRALEIGLSAEAYTGRGECYMEMYPPDYNLATNDFINALDLDRSNPQALSNLGHVYVNYGGDPQAGLRYLDEALALNPQDDRAHRDRGLAHAQLREFDVAEADLKKAIEADAADYENFSALAQIYLAQEKFAEAADALTEAIRTYQPTKSGEAKSFLTGYILRADARLRLAELTTDAAERQAAVEAALADANAVLAAYPDRFPESGRALFRRGRAERMLERYSDAVDSFRRAIEAAQGQNIEYIAEAYLYRGICFYYIGSLGLARGDFEQASSVGNGFTDPRVYLWIGFTHHKQGEYREAIEAYSQALSKSPGFAMAHTNKGRAYMDLGEYSRAIESFNNAIRAEPDVGEHYYNLAFAYLKQQEFEPAVDFFNLALRQKNPQPKMYRGMAAALRGMGREELARQYEQQAEAPQGEASGG